LLTHRQTNKQTDKVWQKHYLLGGGNYSTGIALHIENLSQSYLTKRMKRCYLPPNTIVPRLNHMQLSRRASSYLS